MALISRTIPNMVEGVSQQPASERLLSQAEVVTNAVPSLVEGNRKRPPTEYVAKITASLLNNVRVHRINRDVSERYAVVVSDGGLLVTDVSGNQKTVTFPDGKGYLTATNPAQDFQLITIADYSFVVNKTVKVAMSTGTTPAAPYAALINVATGNYNAHYEVLINGTSEASVDTTTASPEGQTQWIAGQLQSQLSANLGAGWTVEVSGSTVYVENATTDFSISTSDSFGGTSLTAAKDSIQNFSDLPALARTGFIIQVAGDPSSQSDNYYVQFTANNGATWGVGTWDETVAPGIPDAFDASTMPHVLVRNADGTFTFQQGTWTGRVSGDQTTAPDPSFVGSTINEVSFFKDRLVFLSDMNVIMSHVGEYFSFFPPTVTTVLDSQVIDATAISEKVSVLRHALPFEDRLLLFSEQEQFTLTGGTVLSPSTVSITQSTAFETSPDAPPIAAGRSVFFTALRGTYTSLREYVTDPLTKVSTAQDVTAHVPRYIDGTISWITAAANEYLLVAMGATESNALYPYKFYWEGRNKLQSAWSEWLFDPTCTILGCFFISTSLYIVAQYADGVYLEKMEVEDGRTDPNATYVTRLDRRLDDTQVTTAYDSGTDQTTITLPYQAVGTMRVVIRDDGVTTLPAGEIVPVVTQSGNTLVVSGDYTSDPLWIGVEYEHRFEFSEQFVRQAVSGGSEAIKSGHLNLRKMFVEYRGTGAFQALVYSDSNPTPFTYQFTGIVAGSSLGSRQVFDGVFPFPIMGNSKTTRIVLSNTSHMPSSFVSAEWEGQFYIRSRR